MGSYKKKQLIICDCGFITTQLRMPRHLLSKNHHYRLKRGTTNLGRPIQNSFYD